MLKSFLRLIDTAETMQHDDWRERIKAKNKVRLKIVSALFAIVLVLLLFVRVIT